MRRMLAFCVVMASAVGAQAEPGVDLPKWKNGVDPSTPQARDDLAAALTLMFKNVAGGGKVNTDGKLNTTFTFTYDWCTMKLLDQMAAKAEVRGMGILRVECDKK